MHPLYDCRRPFYELAKHRRMKLKPEEKVAMSLQTSESSAVSGGSQSKKAAKKDKKMKPPHNHGEQAGRKSSKGHIPPFDDDVPISRNQFLT